MNYSEFTSVSRLNNYNNNNGTKGAANKSEIEYIEIFNLFIAERTLFENMRQPLVIICMKSCFSCECLVITIN